MKPAAIFLLRREIDGGAALNSGFRKSLLVVKASQKIGGAYLAFASEELARRFVRWKPPVEIVSASDLGGDTAGDLTTRPLVLFETEAQVDACVSDPGHFPYEALLARLTPEGQLIRRVAYLYEPPNRRPGHALPASNSLELNSAAKVEHARPSVPVAPGPRSRAQNVALVVSLIFIVVSLFDGHLKIRFMREPLAAFWLFDITRWLFLPITLMLILHGSTSINARDYRADLDGGMKHVMRLLPLPLLTLFPLYFIASWISGYAFDFPPPPFQHTDTLVPLGPLWILGTLYYSVTAGVWESLFFISLPWFWFSGGREIGLPRTALFVAVTSALFGYAHWENGAPEIIATFVFGVGAAGWAIALRGIWPVVITHALIDVYALWPN